jgi:hypothetical protein
MTDTIHFEHAPLDEVVCGVRLEGVEWSDIHFGLFYAELNGRYPQTQRRPPLPPFVFNPIQVGEVQLTWTTELDLPLLWYKSATSPFLLQVQKNAFLVNWRRQSGRFTYPHFRTTQGGPGGVWEHFLAEWQLFYAFCETHKLGTPQVPDFSVVLLLVVFRRLPGEGSMKVHAIPGVPSSRNARDASG